MADEKKERYIKKYTKEKLLSYISQNKSNMKEGQAFGGTAEVQNINNLNSLDGVRTKLMVKTQNTSFIYYTVAKDKAEIFDTLLDDPNIKDINISVVSENFFTSRA